MKTVFKMITALAVTVLATGCAVYPSPQSYNTHLSYSNGYQGYSNTVQPVQVVNNNRNPQVYVDSAGNRYISQDGRYAQVVQTPQYQPQYPQYQSQYYQQPQQQYVQPRYTQQYPQQQYYQQQPQYRSQPSTGGALIGGAVGGLALSGVGKGNGNLAAIAAGSATGSVVGAGCRTTNGGQILGAVVGGLLGSQVGKGSGRQVATAIGSGTGALVGNDMAGGCLR